MSCWFEIFDQEGLYIDDCPCRLGAIRFLVFRFRPNVWWFGLVLLARGPLLVLPGVLATNTPSLRLTLMNMILQTSLVLQVWYLPWKAPILNLVDALSMSLLVMLVNVALGYADNSGRFATEVLQSLGTVTCALSYSALSFWGVGHEATAEVMSEMKTTQTVI